MSADIFSFKEDIYVAMAAPNTNSCVIMEWDHIEMNFRKFDNITGLGSGCFFFVFFDDSAALVQQKIPQSSSYYDLYFFLYCESQICLISLLIEHNSNHI